MTKAFCHHLDQNGVDQAASYHNENALKVNTALPLYIAVADQSILR